MIQPIGGKVAIKPIEDAEVKKQGSLFIPSTGIDTSYTKGTVIAVGRGAYCDGVLIPSELKIDDIVFFNKMGAVEITQDGVKMFVINEPNVVAVIK